MFIIGAMIFAVTLLLSSCATLFLRKPRKEEPPPNAPIILKGKNVVISGDLLYFSNHEELMSKLESAGANVSRRISNKTDFLIVGELTTTGRMQDVIANDKGIKILLENEIVPYL